MNIVNIDPMLIDDINYHFEIDSSLSDPDELDNLTTSDLKKHTKLIAENFQIPFYTGFVGHMSDFCHIHESYSFKEYNNIIKRCE